MAAQGQSKVCPKCFEVNDPAATFCIECGAPLSDDPAAEGSDQEVYREITQANLHRIRSEYKEAVDVCLGILKRYPNNGTAHTLLGDIYAEQGELEQSVQWFEMALDLRPESLNDSRKLETVQRRMSEQEAASTAKLLGIPESAPRTQQYVYVIAILIAIVGTGGFLVGRSLGPEAGFAKNVQVDRPIEIGRPDAKDDAPTEEPVSETVPVTTTSLAWPGTQSDQQMVQQLSSKYTVGRKILSVRSDPRGPGILLTGRLSKDDKPEEVAAEFARAVFLEYPDVNFVAVHLTNGQSTLYAADATRESFQKMVDEKLDANSILSHVWTAPAP